MSGSRHLLSGARSVIALISVAFLSVIGLVLVAAGPAQAATTVKGQLALTGVTTADNPTGGSVLGIHPGDTVTLTASLAPTAGLDKLGLGGLVSGVTSLLASYQVDADFSKLPGGKKDTVLTDKTTKTFTFPKVGTYNFTWAAQSVGLLGVVPINLDGNQLAAAGVKLNAKNQYVGQIVVAKNPPKGGISVQLPGVSVQPELPVVGKLPKIGLPGVTTPTVPVTIPDLNPTKGKTSNGGTTKKTGTTGVGGVLSVPAQVVPQGTGGVYGTTSNYQTTLQDTSGSSVLPADLAPVPATTHSATKGTTVMPTAATPAKRVADVASSRPSSSGLPVILAIAAMIALVLVAGTYARLFLLRRTN